MKTSVQGRIFLAQSQGMLIDAQGEAEIDHFEGTVLHVYLDAAGKPSVGTGHLLGPADGELWTRVEAVMTDGALDAAARVAALKAITITQAQNDQILESDLRGAEGAVNARVREPLTQNEFDALVSFTFNIGTGGLLESTTLHRLNAGDFEGAADAMLMWDKRQDPKTGELVFDAALFDRRQAERALFLSDIKS